MFQSFEVKSDPATSAPRLAKLRIAMKEQSLDGFLVPRADEHQGEYVPAHAERLSWLTGFSGSAGQAAILSDTAALFVDGRYTLQARNQIDVDAFQIHNIADTSAPKWLAANLSKGTRLGFDPWLHTVAQTRQLEEALKPSGVHLIPVTENLVDTIWGDQPEPPQKPVTIHSHVLAGKGAYEKLDELQQILIDAKVDLCVLTDPASIAWAFNIRGADVPHTPLPLSFCILRHDGIPILFIDRAKLNIETRAYLTQLADLSDPKTLGNWLKSLSPAKKVMLDPNLAATWLSKTIIGAGGKVVEQADPAILPRAKKTEAEIENSQAAHLRDGAAIVRFLAVLDGKKPGTIDEITAVKALETSRTKAGAAFGFPLKDISFDTIAGSGPNGAIVHYRVSTQTNRKLQDGELFLLDSGAQYEDGTTDITRTIAIGEPSDEMRRNFTRVLKGHIAIALLRFPKGTRGVDIDAVARVALWQAGLDFGHGTGHGVGSYLSVHEGPQSISRRGMVAFEDGMIVSNEPGYYKEGEYGIRIENLVVVRGPEDIEGGEVPMFGFQTISFVPIDQKLIVSDMLTDEELHWLNAYHGAVRQKITPLVDDKTGTWLHKVTEPITRDLPSASA